MKRKKLHALFEEIVAYEHQRMHPVEIRVKTIGVNFNERTVTIDGNAVGPFDGVAGVDIPVLSGDIVVMPSWRTM